MDHPNVHYQEMQGKQVWQQSSTGSITLDHVEVSDDAIVGELDEGFNVMVTTLNGGRLFIAALALSSLAFAVDRCRHYAQERIQFDEQPIGRFQRVQDVILDMDIALEQGLTWLLHLVRQYNAGTLSRESAAKVKIECSRRASELHTLAMEICGGIAGMDEFGLIRHAHDLFVCRVGEGSNFALKTLADPPKATRLRTSNSCPKIIDGIASVKAILLRRISRARTSSPKRKGIMAFATSPKKVALIAFR
jgi:alkylation response protein AidB-like acyl-CoA dehydrogenase